MADAPTQESGAAEAAGAMAMLDAVEERSDAAARNAAARHVAQAEELRARADGSEAELARARQSLARAREELQEGREVIGEMEVENEQLQEAHEGMQEQVDAYEAEIDRLDEELEALPGLRRQHAAAKDEQLELMREVATLRNLLGQRDAEVLSLAATNAELTMKYSDLLETGGAVAAAPAPALIRGFGSRRTSSLG